MDKVLIAIEDENCIDPLVQFLRKYPLGKSVSLRLVHVVQDPRILNFMSALPSEFTSDIFRQRKEKGKLILKKAQEAIEESLPNFSPETVLLEGVPKIELLAYIEEYKPDLIILGSHHKSGLKSLGSVSQAVANGSSGTVLTVPVAY
jgi:nucleotide-binding universal stress UspA family protein